MKRAKEETRWSRLNKKWRWTIGILVLIGVIVIAYIVVYEISKFFPPEESKYHVIYGCYNVEVSDIDWDAHLDGINVVVSLKITADYQHLVLDFNLTLKNGQVYNESRLYQLPEDYAFGHELTEVFHFPVLEDIDALRLKVHSCG
ncbi:MAG: hypothetical protein KAW39_01910 [Thermoplasmata archaeon]|nr:hypothetical protein [Thermoplasmata archaeon]